jgi:hypothetical protein
MATTLTNIYFARRLCKQPGVVCGPAYTRGQGFEPRYAAPKAAVLPLNDPRTAEQAECRGPDLNWGHRNFQSRALPTELPRPETKTGSCQPVRTSLRFQLGIRAGGGIRTHDLLLGKETFYH